MVHGLPERKREYGAGILLLERRPADQTKLGLFWAGTSITSHPLSTAKTTGHICLIHEVKVSKITVIARKHDWEDRGRSARAYSFMSFGVLAEYDKFTSSYSASTPNYIRRFR